MKEIPRSQPRPDLRESYTFWSTVAAVLVVIGGIVIGADVSITVPEKISIWDSGWFIFGLVIVGLGVVAILWAVILYLTYRRGGDRDGLLPSPENARRGSLLPAVRGAANGSRAAIDEKWMRSVLREVRPELQESIAMLSMTQKTGHYWSSSAGPLPDYAWNKNRHKLSGMANIGSLYDDLDVAFGHIRRINALHTARMIDRSTITRLLGRNLVRPEDEVAVAVVAVRGAIGSVEQQLNELG